MSEVLLWVVYLGGIWYAPKGAGFWEVIFWPFWLGRSLAYKYVYRSRKYNDNTK